MKEAMESGQMCNDAGETRLFSREQAPDESMIGKVLTVEQTKNVKGDDWKVKPVKLVDGTGKVYLADRKFLEVVNAKA